MVWPESQRATGPSPGLLGDVPAHRETFIQLGDANLWFLLGISLGSEVLGSARQHTS